MQKKDINIMIVDDESLILDVCEKLINHLGYNCIKAKDESEAINIYKDYLNKSVKIHLVIIDLTLANNYSGDILLKELLKIDKNTTAVISSGYLNDPVMLNYSKYGFKNIIKKPYGLNELQSLIEKIIPVLN